MRCAICQGGACLDLLQDYECVCNTPYYLDTFELDRNCMPIHGLIAFTSFAQSVQGDTQATTTTPLRHTSELGFTDLHCDHRTINVDAEYGITAFNSYRVGGTSAFCYTTLSSVAVDDLTWVMVRVKMYLASTSWASASFLKVWLEVDDGYDIYGAPQTMLLPLLDSEGYDLDEYADELGLTEGSWNVLEMNITCNNTLQVHMGLQSFSSSQYVLFDEVVIVTSAAEEDFCVSSPCRNGATCTSPVGMYRYVCVCPVGFEGFDCEYTVTSECASNPCRHGGTCVDAGVQMYRCTCPVLFDLPNLELDENCDPLQDVIAFSSFSHAQPGSVLYRSSSVGMELGFESVGCETQFVDETGDVIAYTYGRVTSAARFKIADADGLCRVRFDDVADLGLLPSLRLSLQIFVAAAQWTAEDRIRVWVEVSPAAVDESCEGTDDSVACAAADISGDDTTSLSNCAAAGDCTYTAGYADVVESCVGTDDAIPCSNADISGDENTSRGHCTAAGTCTYSAGSAESCSATVTGINDAECAGADLSGSEQCVGTDDAAACAAADLSHPDTSSSASTCEGAGECTYTAAVTEECTAVSTDVGCASADISGDEATSRSNCENAGDCNYRASVSESCDGTDDVAACSAADLSSGNHRANCEGNGDCTYYPPQTRQEACEAAGACTYVAGIPEACEGTDDVSACAAADLSGGETASEDNCDSAGLCTYTAGVGVVQESCAGSDDATRCSSAELLGDETESRNNCIDAGDCTYFAHSTQAVVLDVAGDVVESGNTAESIVVEGQWTRLELNLTGYDIVGINLGLESGSPYNYVLYDEIVLSASVSAVNHCDSAPCQNGGSCIAPQDCTCEVSEDEVLGCSTLARCRSPADYVCICAQGFEGDNCQFRVLDECASTPCLNGGICVDGVQSYTCRCPALYGMESLALDSNCDTDQTVVAYTSFNGPSLGAVSHKSTRGAELGFEPSGCQFTSADSGVTENRAMKISAPEQFCYLRFDRVQLGATCTGTPANSAGVACTEGFDPTDSDTCSSGCRYTAAIDSNLQLQVKMYVPSMGWTVADYIQVWVEVEDGQRLWVVNTYVLSLPTIWPLTCTIFFSLTPHCPLMSKFFQVWSRY